MKFGVLQFFSWPERRVELTTVYERALQRIYVMDQSGYDAVWLAEHHFTGYSVCPSVHLMGMHVADRTQNLRIGMAVSLAAFYHPLRLAEEVALLDVMSGGRMNWGAGRGFDPKEFAAFGVPPEESHERFREAVAIVIEDGSGISQLPGSMRSRETRLDALRPRDARRPPPTPARRCASAGSSPRSRGAGCSGCPRT